MRAGPEARYRVIETEPALEAVRARNLCAPGRVALGGKGRVRVPDRARAAPARPRCCGCCCCQERPTSGRLSVGRAGPGGAHTGPDPGVPPRRRLRVPGLQADPRQGPSSRTWSSCRGCSVVPVAQQARRTYQVLKWVGLQHRHQRLSAGAVRRRAAAGRHRPRAGERAGARSSPTSRPGTSIRICRSRS